MCVEKDTEVRSEFCILDFSLMYVRLNQVEGVWNILLLFTAVQVEPYIIYLECYYF